MNSWVEPPPRRPTGCFAKGCLILAAFVVALAIACCAGVYWGFHRHSAIARSLYWLTRTHAISDGPAALPFHQTSDEEIQGTLERWRNFETTARSGQTAEIELSADDLNNLVASDSDTRDKVFVSIEQNRLRLQISVPLNEIVGRSGYYLNGDVAIELNGEEPLVRPRLSNITINNQRLPPDILDWKYRARRLGDYLADSERPWDTTTVEIRDGKVILRTRAE